MNRYQFDPESGKIHLDRPDRPIAARVLDPWGHVEPSNKSAAQRDQYAALGHAMAAGPELLAIVERLLPLARKSFGALAVDINAAKAAIARAKGEIIA